MLFNMEKRDKSADWAMDLINDGILPGYSTGSYVGVSALKNSDVLTAVSYIASYVARFPIIERDQKDNVVEDKMLYLVNKEPNSMLDAYHWRFIMAVSAILANDGFSRIVRDPLSGKPALIQYYPTSQVYIDDSDTNNIKYEFTPLNGNKTIVEEASNVIHFKFFTYDGIHGRSPLLSLRDEINLQESGIQTLTKFFKSGLKGGILHAKGKLSKESRKQVRKDFEYAQADANAGSPIITDDTFDYQTLDVDTNILQLINSNNYSTTQIAKALHIPSYKLGINSPNQSVSQLNEDFINSDLPYYFEPIIAEFESKLLTARKRTKVSLNFDTRKETGLSITDAVNAVKGALLTPNRALAESGRATVDDPNMDRMQSDLNSVFLDKKEEYQLKGGEVNGKEPRKSTDPDESGAAGE